MTLTEFEANHRGSRITIGGPVNPTVIIPKQGGGFWAQIQHVQLLPLILDDELLIALPAKLRSAVTALEPAGPMTLFVDQFIVDTTADKPERSQDRRAPGRSVRGARMSSAALRDDAPSPWIYWQGANIRLAGASLNLGLKCDNVHGVIAMSGEYRNNKLNTVDGNLLIEQAMILKQPVQNIHAQLLIDSAKAPGVVQIRNIKAKLFGGDIGGEAALMIEPIVRFDVRLKVLGVKLEEIDRQNRITPDGQLAGRGKPRSFCPEKAAIQRKCPAAAISACREARSTACHRSWIS